MKSGFIFILFTFGTFICATHSAPISFDVRHAATSQELLVNLLNQITKSQMAAIASGGESDDDDEASDAISYRNPKYFQNALDSIPDNNLVQKSPKGNFFTKLIKGSGKGRQESAGNDLDKGLIHPQENTKY